MDATTFSAEPLLRIAQALPGTPRIMAEMGRLLRDPNTDLDEITSYLKRDAALAARLLRVANSAAFAQSEPVGSVEAAASLVGLQEIYRLVGAVAVDQFSDARFPLYGIPGKRLRENSLLVALIMEELANCADQDPHIAYTIGLFRSVGKLALEKLAAEHEPVPPLRPDVDDMLIWEKHSFGLTSNHASATILNHWKFPLEIGVAISEHYQPFGQKDPLTSLLNIAASTAANLDYGLPGEGRFWVETDAVYDDCGMDPEKTERYIDRAQRSFERVNRAIG